MSRIEGKDLIPYLTDRVPAQKVKDEKKQLELSLLFGETLNAYKKVLDPDQYQAFINFGILAHTTEETSISRYSLFNPSDSRNTLLPGLDLTDRPFRIPKHLAPSGHKSADVINRYRKIKLFEDQIVFPQSPASLLPYLVLNSFSARQSLSQSAHLKVFDACASPGNKTFNMMYLNDKNIDKISLVANDINPQRLEKVAKRLEEYGFKLTNGRWQRQIKGKEIEVILTNLDASSCSTAEKVYDILNDHVDIAICDVPCDQTGMIYQQPMSARFPMIESYDDDRFDTEYQICQVGIDLIRSNGLLSFSTCTISPIANEGLVSILNSQPHVKSIPLPRFEGTFQALSNYQGQNFNCEPDHGIRTYPLNFWRTGFFCSVVQKL